MPDRQPRLAARLAPRSAVAVADLELLRVARTELSRPPRIPRPSMTDRLRARFGRATVEDAGS